MPDQNYDGARVRHVPIEVEAREHTNDGANHNNHQNRRNQGQSHSSQPHQQYQQIHQDQAYFPHNFASRTHHNQPAPNTSYIDINYMPHQEHMPYQQQQQTRPQDANRQSNQHVDQSSQMDVQFDDVQDINLDKENSKIPEVIPLPPPPEQPIGQSKSSQPQDETGNYGQPKQQQEHEQSTPSGADRKNMDNGPMSVINATKFEVNKLLKEIASCTETSSTSKECKRLDEFLTQCTLRLDGLQCGNSPELRQQRKAVITLIDKCTSILQRKVDLNRDILQIIMSSSKDISI